MVAMVVVVVTDGGDCCGEVTDGDDGYGCGNRGWYGFLILDTELSLFIALAKFISLLSSKCVSSSGCSHG